MRIWIVLFVALSFTSCAHQPTTDRLEALETSYAGIESTLIDQAFAVDALQERDEEVVYGLQYLNSLIEQVANAALILFEKQEARLDALDGGVSEEFDEGV